MKKIFLLAFLIMGICNTCILTTTALLSNATYDLESDTCLTILDLNTTINWTVKDYGVNTTINGSTPYINSEAGIEVHSVSCPVCESRDWQQINISSGGTFLDTYSETFYQCLVGTPSYFLVQYYLNAGEVVYNSERNVQCLANNYTVPSGYCYQNYTFNETINSTEPFVYSNSKTNVSIEVKCNESVRYNYYPWKNVNVYCGQTLEDAERNLTLIGPSCTNALNQVLDLTCPSTYAFGNPTNLTINVADKVCPDIPASCPECEECENCTEIQLSNCPTAGEGNYTTGSFNVEALLYWNDENCTSFSQVCRDYFYQIPCSIEEADAGNLSSCVKRVYEEKDNIITQCEEDKTQLNANIDELTQKVEEGKISLDTILYVVGMIMIIFVVPLVIAVVVWYAKKTKLVGQEKKTPNPKLPDKLKGEMNEFK